MFSGMDVKPLKLQSTNGSSRSSTISVLHSQRAGHACEDDVATDSKRIEAIRGLMIVEWLITWSGHNKEIT